MVLKTALLIGHHAKNLPPH
jgi:hypothetical protein